MSSSCPTFPSLPSHSPSVPTHFNCCVSLISYWQFLEE
jgi:hypothetical protein